MGRTCVVEACGSEYYPDCGLSFHRFPKDPNVREIWKNIIPISSTRKLTDASVVCSKHFKAQDFVVCLSRPVLKSDAVPSVYLLNQKKLKMEDLVYCRICLVTDVRMYSLDNTSNDSIGSIYLHLSQIQTYENNQHVCFECASLLQKYQLFKSKCLRAHNILCHISDNSKELVTKVIQNIDRKLNKLESNLQCSPTKIFFGPSNDSINCNIKINSMTFDKDYDDNTSDLEIKSEIETANVNEECKENSTAFHEHSFKGISEEPLNLEDYLIKETKTEVEKEHKAKRRKKSNEIVTNEIESPNVINTSLDDYNDDNDFIEAAADNISDENDESAIETSKTNIKKESKAKKRKSKTVQSDVHSSDNEPLSKRANDITDKIDKHFKRKAHINLEFFDDYGTVVFLTPDDAKKELLSRKESKNYKISPFKCNFCYKGYEAKTTYDNHMKGHRIENGDYECEICHLRFPAPIHLCKHKLSCHRRKFSCKLCSYICYCMYQARTHVRLHKGQKYPCKDCGEIFSMPNSLFMHKRLKHFNSSVTESVCEICGDIFGSARGLFLHNKKLHRTDKNSKQGPKCEECSVQFSSEVAWKRHLVLSARHTVINGCKFCGERFTNVDELKSHRRAHHQRFKRQNDKKLPAVCPLCKKWMSNRVEYETHVRTEHPLSEEGKKLADSDIALFVCEVCGQAFKQQCFLIYHQRKHTGERPYKCQDCGKTFQMAAALTIHQTVHKPKHSYKCDICAKVFSSKSSLNKHMKLHLGIRPHKCLICDKGFLHMCDLRMHIKYVHDKVPWPKKKSKRNVADDNGPYDDFN